MIYFLIVISLLFIVLLYLVINLLLKNEKQEQILLGYWFYLNKISEIIKFTDDKLKSLDEKEIFKSDDDIGFFFNNVKEIQNIINNFKIENEQEILDRGDRKSNNRI